MVRHNDAPRGRLLAGSRFSQFRGLIARRNTGAVGFGAPCAAWRRLPTTTFCVSPANRRAWRWLPAATFCVSAMSGHTAAGSRGIVGQHRSGKRCAKQQRSERRFRQ